MKLKGPRMADTSIDDKTKISLFAVAVGLPTIIISAMWLAALSARSDQALATSVENERRIEKQMDVLLEIKDRVIRIEEQLKKGDHK